MNVLMAMRIADLVGSTASLYDLPVSDDGKIYAKSLFDSLVKKFQDHAYIFYDTETTGLPNQLPNVQITQISAVAVGMKDFLPDVDGFKPDYLGHMHGTADLTQYTIDNLDTPRGGWTIRQTLEFNRFPIEKWFAEKGLTLPEIPSDYKGPARRKTIELPEYGKPVHVDAGDMPPGFSPEADLLEEFIEFVRDIKSKYKNVVLVAHNAPFDRGFISERCRINGINSSFLNTCKNLDSQAFMQLYVDPVVRTMEDQTLQKNFELMIGKKANKYNLDFVNSALGILNSKASHTSSADVKALVVALSKCMMVLHDAGDLDVRKPIEQSIVERRTPITKEKMKREKRTDKFQFRSKYMIDSPDDDNALKSLKDKARRIETRKVTPDDLAAQKQKQDDLDFIIEQINEHYVHLLDKTLDQIADIDSNMSALDDSEVRRLNLLNAEKDRLMAMISK